MGPMRITEPGRTVLWTAFWIAAVAAIGWVDLVTGPEYGFGFFYMLLVVPAAWTLGRTPGVIVALASGFAWFLADAVMRGSVDVGPVAWNASSRMFVFVAGAIVVDALHRERERLRRVDRERSLFLRVLEHELPRPSRELVDALRTRQAAGGATAAELRPLIQRAEDLEFLSREFVSLGQLQSGSIWLHHKPLDLRALVEEVRAEAKDGGSRLPTTLSGGSFLTEGDPARLRQAFTALLVEARASATASELSIDLRRTDGEAQLTLSAGVGPFLPAGSADGGGVAVELARMIIEGHRGSLEVRREAASKAVRFEVRLPLSR